MKIQKKLDSLLITSNHPMQDFCPASDDPCYCNSNKAFGECCGSTSLKRSPPVGLCMFENYLSNDFTNDLTEYAEKCAGQRLMVIDNKESTPDNIIKVEDQRRIAERVDLGDRKPEILDIVRSTFIELADKCFGQSLDWFESPDLMRYREGGYYVKHADSQNMETETRTWSKVIDRDLSLLIYLNDDFEGGELSFYKLNYQVRPRAGAAVIFPSDHRYLHQAETVNKGVRYAIVSWASVKGIPKVASRPPDSAIIVN